MSEDELKKAIKAAAPGDTIIFTADSAQTYLDWRVLLNRIQTELNVKLEFKPKDEQEIEITIK